MPTTFANSIDSNPIYAQRAENDKDGNRIDQTYAKSASLATVASSGSYDDLSNKPTINNVPAVTSSDDNKVLKASYTGGVGSYSWENETGTTYSAGTGIDIDQNNVISADTTVLATQSDLGSYTPTSSLATVATTGNYSDLSGKPTIPSVDQTYNAASTNAQSGVAVAQAIAAIPSTSYTAGDGISIENDEISAKLGDGLEIGTAMTPVTITAHALGYSDRTYELGPSVIQQLDASLAHAVETTGLTLSIQNVIDNNNVSQHWVYNRPTDLKLYPAICRIGTDAGGPYADNSNALVLSTTGIDVSGGNGVIPAGTQFTYNLNDINTTLSTTDWATISANPANYTLSVCFSTQYGFFVTCVGSDAFTKNALYDSGTITKMEAVLGAIAVSNPLPASTSSDANKVLKVNASGEPEWATGGGGGGVNADWDETDPLEPSYIENKPTPKTLTAGANISISEGVGTLTISAAAGLPASTAADEGKCLVVDSNGDPEWGTGGKTYTGTDGVVVDNVNDTVGLEAPVDIVAGPGIAIDNPDGNTVRISYSGYNETLLWSSSTAASSFTLSEIITNFERLKLLMQYNGMKSWCDGTVVSAAQFTVACCGYANNSGDGNRLQLFGGSFTSSDGKSFASEAGKCIYFSNGNASIGGGVTSACTFLKIYGINRVAND